MLGKSACHWKMNYMVLSIIMKIHCTFLNSLVSITEELSLQMMRHSIINQLCLYLPSLSYVYSPPFAIALLGCLNDHSSLSRLNWVGWHRIRLLLINIYIYMHWTSNHLKMNRSNVTIFVFQWNSIWYEKNSMWFYASHPLISERDYFLKIWCGRLIFLKASKSFEYFP